jgi:hypothetical protein
MEKIFVKIQATIYAHVEFFKPPVINSDTIGDYKAELDSALHNAALNHILTEFDKFQEISIDSVQPEYDGVEEYGNILNSWQKEYNEKII